MWKQHLRCILMRLCRCMRSGVWKLNAPCHQQTCRAWLWTTKLMCWTLVYVKLGSSYTLITWYLAGLGALETECAIDLDEEEVLEGTPPHPHWVVCGDGYLCVYKTARHVKQKLIQPVNKGWILRQCCNWIERYLEIWLRVVPAKSCSARAQWQSRSMHGFHHMIYHDDMMWSHACMLILIIY